MTRPDKTPTTPISYDQLQKFLHELSDTIGRVKIQTGELAQTKNQINELYRDLRGHDVEPGLIGRFVILERSLTDLVKEQIPKMLAAINTSVSQVNEAKNMLQTCQLHHDVDTQQVRGEIERLRAEYQAHLDAEKKEQEKEEKEEAKFGGREWFRQNASGLIMSAITTLVTALVSAGVTALVVEKLLVH